MPEFAGFYGKTQTVQETDMWTVSPTSQFLNRNTYMYALELVLATMALFVDQSRSVLMLWLAKAWEFREIVVGKCV